MTAGVTIVDPDTTYVDRGVEVGQDTVILPFTCLEGRTKIGKDCVIGPQTRIIDSQLVKGNLVESSLLRESEVGARCTVGPYAYLRPGTVLADNVKVEIENRADRPNSD